MAKSLKNKRKALKDNLITNTLSAALSHSNAVDEVADRKMYNNK